ncbi:MAG: alpha-L-fucosidase [Halobacteriaceae archaeon]
MQTYEPTWASLEEHQIPAWLHDAPFGVYFHWGPYSVPAYQNEWYSRNMYREGSDQHDHHVSEYGELSDFGYKDFVPEFTAENWDPEEWARLCDENGADFVGIAAIHADGFALWDSELTRWNAANMGPERDVVGELADAVRARDLKFLTSFHHDFHWWWYAREEGWDTADPAYADLYGPAHDPETPPPESYFADWRDKVIEVIDGYRPDVVYFDSAIGNDWFVRHHEYLREVLAHYYNKGEEWGKPVEFTAKTNVPPGVGMVDHERTRADEVRQRPWLTDTSVDESSWCYVQDPDYKDAATIVRGLVDRVSKHGRLLLNLGPKPDGTFDRGSLELLDAVGDWLDVNGEALRAARPWWTYGEGPTEVSGGEREAASRVEYTPEDVRYTRVGQTLYAVLLGWPEEPVRLETPVGRRESAHAGEWQIGPEPDAWPDDDYTVSLLGSDADVEWRRVDGGDALEVDLPAEPPCEHAYALRIEVERVNHHPGES